MNRQPTDDQIAIKLENVTKEYTIHHEKPTLVEKFVKGKTERFTALNNINLTIKKGGRVGIIGPNGSGKTTLLKVIAGITTPTHGTLKTSGKTVSLIDLQAGFHGDLTGYQNIFVNGMLLGMSKEKISHKVNSIISYADIRQFIDAPLYTFSSGMALRLGFSVAVHAEPDILLLDENLSTGDNEFRKKSRTTIQKFFRNEKTIIIVSHEQELINSLCDRVIRMKNGMII